MNCDVENSFKAKRCCYCVNFFVEQTISLLLWVQITALVKKIAKLVNEQQTIGRYSINFNATHLARGVYIYELRCGEFIQSKKMLLLR